jgi:hypothetical protein
MKVDMATWNEGASDIDRRPPTEERSPSERRADKGPRRMGLWAIVVGTLVLGIVLAALDFAGRAEREQHQPPPDDSPAAQE